MNNPDAKTAANTPAPAPQTIPVERLIDSMKPKRRCWCQGKAGFCAAPRGYSHGNACFASDIRFPVPKRAA